MSKLKASRKTKSKAYEFIKSLMKDGADGNDIHNLVTAISENISSDIAGTILLDLLRNPEDVNADISGHTHWFGPITVSWYAAIIKEWAEYCRDTELRGTFRFGDLNDWEQWNKRQNKHTADEIKKFSQQHSESIMIFEWWADDVTTIEVNKFVNELYDRVKLSLKEKLGK